MARTASPSTGRDSIADAVARTPAARALGRRLAEGGIFACEGLDEATHPFFAALVRQLAPDRPVVVVTDGLKSQEKFQQDLETWFHDGSDKPARPLFHPAWEVLPHESKLPHADVISERLETLVALSRAGEPGPARPLIVTSVIALCQRTFPAGEVGRLTRVLRRGDTMDPLDVIEWLESIGYEPEARVSQKGELSLRGGILDLFPLTSPWPVRCEFFGNELESLREFDPATQVSRGEIDAISVSPGGELGLLKRRVAAAPGATSPTGAVANSTEPLGTLLDHLPAGTIFLLASPDELDRRAADYRQQLPPDDPFFISWPEFLARIEAGGFTCVELNGLATDDPGASSLHGAATAGTVRFPLSSLDAFRPLEVRASDPQVAESQRREFFGQLHRWTRQGYAVHVFCNNDGERQRFGEIWAELNALPAADGGPSSASIEPPPIHLGALSRGFLAEEARLVVITDAEVFGRYKVQRPRRLKSPHAPAMRSALDIDFADLEEGSLVVHLQHGIGRFVGLRLMPSTPGRRGQNAPVAPTPEPGAQPAGQECLVIEYAANGPDDEAPRLYVPVSEAHLVSKYVGAGKARPPLNMLGGTRWTKAREQAERAVRDLAAELLQIQAQRETQAGHPFPADNPWQREFEAGFLYEETPDQMRAIETTKRDMETARPMDRLICGDVGFGKTEVAIRAAFKAVMGGKQVAILVPTTVLAAQHYNNFCERMADYPVRIDLLSRFRTARQQKATIAAVNQGAVDIVVGTHRLLSKDLQFKDLGLVVVDEEQRFGVMHKEKFKLLRRMVDVLTMSATPIPRTLYLALTGARDMSTIETPPQDRLPVETVVAKYDERTVREAIQRELNRGGQVFYLHNRVQDIDAVASRLKELVPQARFAVGHGQMDPDDLEDVMTRFVNGEADVLVSTTIIESGIDIPNANTIIIDRADRFGLSDLYQLRGRVGRYKHQAYAYLLLPRHAALLGEARKRISAMKQYSTLGAGFKIAMRDLEIRGAGNLLGPQQSGHITAVGFELYCQLLKQSVSTLKGERPARRIEAKARLDFLAFDPGEEDPTPAPAPEKPARKRGRPAEDRLEISIEREGPVYYDDETPHFAEEEVTPGFPGPKAPAYVPYSYIADSRQRIDFHRRLAQVQDKAGLDQLRAELRDRFGPLPTGVEHLLLVSELKLLAADRQITFIETKADKLMLLRAGDYLQVAGKFPRLAKVPTLARLREIKHLLLSF